MDTIAGIGMGKRRRFWSDEEKRRIVAQARLAEVSVSEVARRYDVNANLVFTWLRDPRFAAEADAPAFLPVTVSAEMEPVIETASAADGQVVIELANGHRLCLRGSFDADVIVRLARGLGA
ncbi:MAG: transposase [Rhodospirillaceae bacterium]|jgi:transposase|nr:transposase [Rhodospirillaceae bacterium]